MQNKSVGPGLSVHPMIGLEHGSMWKTLQQLSPSPDHPSHPTAPLCMQRRMHRHAPPGTTLAHAPGAGTCAHPRSARPAQPPPQRWPPRSPGAHSPGPPRQGCCRPRSPHPHQISLAGAGGYEQEVLFPKSAGGPKERVDGKRVQCARARVWGSHPCPHASAHAAAHPAPLLLELTCTHSTWPLAAARCSGQLPSSSSADQGPEPASAYATESLCLHHIIMISHI